MDRNLKLSDIVERARLKRWTVAYVLKHPNFLDGMPSPPGKPGVHRLFGGWQAFRLSLFSILVDQGFKLPTAREIQRYALSVLRSRLKKYADEPEAQIYLWVRNGEWMMVDRAGSHGQPQSKHWYPLANGEKRDPNESPIFELSVNLTGLEALFADGAPI